MCTLAQKSFTFYLQCVRPDPHWTRARKFECKSFDVACVQCGHPHSHQQVPFACVARARARPVWIGPKPTTRGMQLSSAGTSCPSKITQETGTMDNEGRRGVESGCVAFGVAICSRQVEVNTLQRGNAICNVCLAWCGFRLD